MGFYTVTLFIAGFVHLLLGLFVLSKNIKSQRNRAFALFEASIVIWSIGMFMMTIASDKQMAMTGVRILHFGLFFSFGNFFYFVLTLIDDQSKRNKIICSTAYILGLLFNITDQIKSLATVSDVIFVFGSYQPVAGKAAPFFNLTFLFFVSYGVYLLYKRYQISESLLEKNRISYVFGGMFIIFISSITNILLVMGLKVYPLAHLAIIIYALIITYAIIKYRLMDISLIIQKGIIYSLLTTLVTTIWLLAIFIFEGVLHFETLYARVLTIVIIIFIFQPIREKIQLLVDKRFYREKHNLQQILKKVSSDISTTLDREDLFLLVLNVIKKVIHPQYAAIMLFDQSKGVYKPEFTFGDYDKSEVFKEDHPIVHWFNQEKRELLKEEVKENPEFNDVKEVLTNVIEKLRMIISIPIIFKEKLIGILNLGSKLSSKVYSNDELVFLSTLSSEIALALENTKLFTELKKYALELEKRAIQLQIANETKSNFLAVVSHELQTPLTVIIGYLNLFLQKTLGEYNSAQEEGLKIMMKRSERLRKLIGNILAFSKAEQREGDKLEEEVVNFKKIIEEVVSTFTQAAQGKQIILQAQIDTNFPLVRYNGKKAKEIFSKLMDNAIKFTPANSFNKVTIGLIDKGSYLQGFVEDTGIGIAAERQEKMFESFYQIDMSDKREYEGLGLGLAIVKKIIENSGGTIKVNSEKDKGSKFVFTLPKKEVI
ncbi:GAF domain-containing sensor histidine kinase [bacterium]|nr:GAF domain-containing sensor histidine kinase [bacterium]MBU1152900.1 GAF domain-containing sensor histidine kinase [bacterium]MBU2599829.1 GAF domain-containing sensor histidine kinase [bacterium]